MPYIKQNDRDKLDVAIYNLHKVIQNVAVEENVEGIINYTITNLLAEIHVGEGWRYRFINRVIGVLECVKLEFYRRLALKYEDNCIEQNGDVEIYKERLI